MTPKWLPAGPPGSSFGDFWGQKGVAGLNFSALGGLFVPVSAFRCPQARPGPPQGPPRAPFLVIFEPPQSILKQKRDKNEAGKLQQ